MADVRNFQEVENLIRKNPGQANSLASEWEKFIKKSEESSPEILAEILSIKTKDEFDKWASKHPEKHVDPSVWEGKEIFDYYYFLQKQQENQQQEKEQASSTEKEEKERTGSNISSSNVRRIIEELEKNEFAQTPPTQVPSPTRSPSLGQQFGEGIGQETEQTGERLAQRGVSNAGRVSSRAAAQAGKVAAQAGRLAAQAGVRIGAFLVTNPAGWVVLGIIVVVIFTAAIVFTVGSSGTPVEAGSQGTNETLSTPAPETTTPPPITPSPTEIPTPAPAAP